VGRPRLKKLALWLSWRQDPEFGVPELQERFRREVKRDSRDRTMSQEVNEALHTGEGYRLRGSHTQCLSVN
jgi:hypothetical protein